MGEEPKIIQRVYEAKEDVQAADRLIGDYLPFIKAEAAKHLKRSRVEETDDECSIAMIAFHEAIMSYSRIRGAFLSYASLLMKSRLIDYLRKETRHQGHLSMEAPVGEDGDTIGERLAADGDHQEELAHRDATRKEIEELSRQMEQFGVSLSDVADNCPRQKRTLSACQKVLECAADDKDLLDEFLRTRKLPVGKLVEKSHVERKTLERHRKYLVALLLICTNGYEIIRGHLKQVLKKGGAAK